MLVLIFTIENMIKEEVFKSVEIVKSGGVLAYPSDTIWGLGCDPKNEEAIDRIIEAKGRPPGKPFILLIHDIGQLYDYVAEIPEVAWDIVDWSEEPLTVVYPKGKNVSSKLLGENGSIAVRLVKKDGFCKTLLRKWNKGLVSTSANIAGMPSPVKYDQIDTGILKQMDYVVSSKLAKETEVKASRIIQLGKNGEYKTLRK